MGSKIQCVLISAVAKAKESYRRYATMDDVRCLNGGTYHNVSTAIGVIPWPFEHGGEGKIPSEELKKDLRWPQACSCGYRFLEEDTWQHNFEQLYEREDTKELLVLRDAPLGAMWDAPWMGERFRGSDGLHLIVRTPGGDWTIDGASSGGGKWTRSGSVPNITARPSILMGEVKSTDGRVISPGYHGWLTDGVLIEC